MLSILVTIPARLPLGSPSSDSSLAVFYSRLCSWWRGTRTIRLGTFAALVNTIPSLVLVRHRGFSIFRCIMPVKRRTLPCFIDPGSCCLIIYSAKVAELARRGAEFGVMMPSLTINMAGVRARKRKMVDGEVRLHLELYKASGAELIMGEARFIAQKTVEVRSTDGTTRVLSGDQVFLNLGTHAAIPDVPGLKAAKPMTHVEALELDRVPEHLVVLGVGFVGLELAQAMRRFGSRVTILERGRQLIAQEDPDVAEEILRVFQEDGIDVLFDTDLLGVEGLSGQGITLHLRDLRGERTLKGSDLLVAAGRIPNTQGMGLEKTGVEVDEGWLYPSE
jgi:pyruvate/2-oxoglutarate dehydrogenase complex dihydrolipoamide dehydrogenase (E3) component